jgi:PAS domain S-box-containing protein
MAARFIQVITFPHDDVAFRAHVEAAQAVTGRWDGDIVERDIRQAYPAAVVRRANPLAELSPARETWYAYRDGDITRGRTTEWWAQDGLPQAIVGATGKYVDANAAAASLFGVSRRRIIGKPAGSFTRHEANDEVGRRLFATLAETGALHSTAVVKRPDGEEWPIEFHMRPTPAADGYVVVMRRIQAPASDRI